VKRKIPLTCTSIKLKSQTFTNLKADSNIQTQQQTSKSSLGSLFSIFPSAADISPSDEPQPKPVKKKKPRQRLS